MSSITDDEDAQKRGVVGLWYIMGQFDLDLAFIRKLAKLRNALPVRFDSIHACHDNPKLLPVFSLGMIIMGARSRMRFRIHYGSHEECRCQLTPFGIPTLSAIPVMSGSARGGEFNLEPHLQFLKKHRDLEAVRLKAEKEYLRKMKEVSTQRRKREQTESSYSTRNFLDGAGVLSFGSMMSPCDPTPMAESVPVPAPAGVESTSSSFHGGVHFNFMSRPPTLPTPWWIDRALDHDLPQAPAFVVVNRGSSFTPSYQLVDGGPVDPQMNDVLFGRGKPIQERAGNVRFRDILELHRQLYDQGEKYEKTAIATDIVRIVKGEGGRFLKQNDNGRGWVEVDDASARVKVSHAFRTRRSILTAAAVHAAEKKMPVR